MANRFKQKNKVALGQRRGLIQVRELILKIYQLLLWASLNPRWNSLPLMIAPLYAIVQRVPLYFFFKPNKSYNTHHQHYLFSLEQTKNFKVPTEATNELQNYV